MKTQTTLFKKAGTSVIGKSSLQTLIAEIPPGLPVGLVGERDDDPFAGIFGGSDDLFEDLFEVTPPPQKKLEISLGVSSAVGQG